MDMLEHKSTVPQKKRSDSSLMWKVAIGFVIAVLLLSLLDKY
jgi:heme/copper-type cytochrome/quinol oxidase subunit 4